MYLLYLDDSGSSDPGNGEHLVLGGVCVYERQVQHFTNALDQIAARFAPNDPMSVEFHASEVYSGRAEPWKTQTRDPQQRRDLIKEVLGVLRNAYDTARAFATVVHKASFATAHPMEMAFEDVCGRFDRFLRRVDDKGLIILDESTYATRLVQLSYRFRTLGSKWGTIRHIVDGPLFVSSRAFRCTQLADHIAYAVFRRFEHGDANYFDVLAPRLDADGRVIHGLSHFTAAPADCLCPACLSRR